MFNKTVESVVEDSGFKCILYGTSGSGKTHSISTAPNQEGVAILSAEAGLRSLKNLCPKTAVEVVKDMASLRAAYEFLVSPEGARFHTVFLDSITEIGEIVLAAEKLKCKDPRMAYGELIEQATRAIKAFRDLPGKNVILIAQESTNQDDMGRIFRGPSMPGKQLGPKLPFWQDAVFCLRVKKDEDGSYKRAFQCRMVDEEYVAKFRGSELEDFEAPDWTVIFSKANATPEPKSKKGGK